jgi:hypothetical protein
MLPVQRPMHKLLQMHSCIGQPRRMHVDALNNPTSFSVASVLIFEPSPHPAPWSLTSVMMYVWRTLLNRVVGQTDSLTHFFHFGISCPKCFLVRSLLIPFIASHFLSFLPFPLFHAFTILSPALAHASARVFPCPVSRPIMSTCRSHWRQKKCRQDSLAYRYETMVVE